MNCLALLGQGSLGWPTTVSFNKRYLDTLTDGEAWDQLGNMSKWGLTIARWEWFLHLWRLYRWLENASNHLGLKSQGCPRLAYGMCAMQVWASTGQANRNQEQESSEGRGQSSQMLSLRVQGRCVIKSLNLLKCAYFSWRLNWKKLDFLVLQE